MYPSPPAGGGVGSYCASFWCDCSAIFLGYLRFSVMCRAAGDPSGVPHLADPGWLPSSCGGGFAWGWGASCYRYPVPHFGFLPCASAAPPPLLPLRGFAPLPGASACLTPIAGLLLRLCWRALCCATWFFSHVPCSSSGPAASLLSLMLVHWGVFRSPGVCPSASLVTWVGFQPFPSFSMLLLLRLLARVPGIVHPVSGCSRYGDGLSLVGGEVTLLPFPYLRVGVLLACGFSGVRGSSRLWVRGRIIWPLAVPGPCCFLVSYLGFFPSRFQCCLLACGGLRFLLSCPPSVALLWRRLT